MQVHLGSKVTHVNEHAHVFIEANDGSGKNSRFSDAAFEDSKAESDAHLVVIATGKSFCVLRCFVTHSNYKFHLILFRVPEFVACLIGFSAAQISRLPVRRLLFDY